MRTGMQLAFAIQRPASAVQYTSQQSLADPGFICLSGRNDTGVGHQAANIASGHEKQPVSGEPDDFRFHTDATGRGDITQLAYRGLATHRFQGQPYHACQTALDYHGVEGSEFGMIAGQPLDPYLTAIDIRQRVSHARAHHPAPW